LVFGRKASSDGLKPENATTIVRSMDLSALAVTGSVFTDLAVAPSHLELFVLDHGAGQITAFDHASRRPAARQLYGSSGVVSQTQFILYSSQDDTIRALKSDGSGHEYSVNSGQAQSN
jgi:hypothetical protein